MESLVSVPKDGTVHSSRGGLRIMSFMDRWSTLNGYPWTLM